MNYEYPYDNQHEVVINRAKFDACTYSSFRGVKTDTQTQLHFICMYYIQPTIANNGYSITNPHSTQQLRYNKACPKMAV